MKRLCTKKLGLAIKLRLRERFFVGDLFYTSSPVALIALCLVAALVTGPMSTVVS